MSHVFICDVTDVLGKPTPVVTEPERCCAFIHVDELCSLMMKNMKLYLTMDGNDAKRDRM